MTSAPLAAITFPPELPVSQQAEKIQQLLETHQVLIVAGETGSGKTTQLPKICLKAGRGSKGLIGHTQPRRLAARSVAGRIAEELGSQAGELVGYSVRFADRVSAATRIKLMTDGILLAEIQQDRQLRKYDTIIIDEAHERSLNIDFLLGYLKRLLPRRPDLKLIITSATIDVEKFSRHFDNAPVLTVSGRTYPVQIEYRPPAEEEGELATQVASVLHEIEQSEKGRSPKWRDVLIFLSGEREIRELAVALRKLKLRHTEILPLYARLSASEQNRIFSAHSGRRIVLSTNVAETSLTVPGIAYVIDAGKARISRYSVRSKVQRLPVEAISQASANQRAGRCGRVCPGTCYRLFSEEDYLSRPEFTDTEIRRTNLAAVILRMLDLGLGDISQFPFIDMPDEKAIRDGLNLLREIGAINQQAVINRTGKKIARLPVDPRFGRIILDAAERGCLEELLIIISALSIQDPRERPIDKQQAADQAHQQFTDPHSDFLFWVNLWQAYEAQREILSQNKLRKYCLKHFLSFMRMREWRDLHRQLKLSIRSLSLRSNQQPADYASIHQALLRGLIGNVARYQEEGMYLGVRNRKFRIFPGSVLARKPVKWLLSAELVETSQLLARMNARVEPNWIEKSAGPLLKQQVLEPHWEKKPGRVMAYEQLSLYGLVIVDKRKIAFSSIDPEQSRQIFIHDGLAEFQLTTSCDFYHRNHELVRELEKIEDKTRRRDIIINHEKLIDFYEQKLPAEVMDRKSLEQWYFSSDRKTRDSLKMSREFLLEQEANELRLEAFPDKITTRDMSLELDYQFSPGSSDDGISVSIPLSALKQVREDDLEWMVPGMLKEKCIALIKALPKQIRKHFVPVPDTVETILPQLSPEDGSLQRSLAKNLRLLKGQDIPLTAWENTGVDEHLKMNIQVTDQQGKLLGKGRELKLLQEQFAEQIDTEFRQQTGSDLEQDGLTEWDFGNLAESHKVDQGSVVLNTYPALVDEHSSVALRVTDSPEKAHLISIRGVARLLLLRMHHQVKHLKKTLLQDPARMLMVNSLGSREEVLEQLIMLSCIACFELETSLPRSRDDFDELYENGRAELLETAERYQQSLYTIVLKLREVDTRLKQFNGLQELEMVADINEQLRGLVSRAALAAILPSQFLNLRRYLEAILERLDKYPRQKTRDQQWTRELQKYRERYINKKEYFDKRGVVSPELEKFRWMLEEYRVSLFAQNLGTAYPISAKRIDKFWNSMA